MNQKILLVLFDNNRKSPEDRWKSASQQFVKEDWAMAACKGHIEENNIYWI